ncbi:MAG TPA: phosphatidylserine decarboxylase [bacterium]|jgi:phosphatidylserine decarboxylase
MRFAPEAFPIVAPFFGLAVAALIWVGVSRSTLAITLAAVFAFLGLVLLAFFRDPVRHTPQGQGIVVSPADGKVLAVESLPDGRKHVAIFLSVFNVHVNRVPFSSQVQVVNNIPGSYFHAGSERASGNARVEVQAESVYGPVGWRQVSGAIARKIACGLKSGDRVKTGDRFGLIYFGSRMDVYLPASAELLAQPGQVVHAGESVIAKFPTEDK